MLFYCVCLRANKYRYNYGRQANRTLKDIMLPVPKKLPAWLDQYDFEDLDRSAEHIRKSIKIEG